ncbi:hypothetical protein KIN20_004721 [Parelaphostrongylus tenuis]|uniref:Uncharacterized protein n=1 Tax=Parelaphostrongylus tenuis TaxID=148309 RepID=A0AAD5LZ95_PARTN|nr:hypothetical protein KIN20_004721 [Parelaphostrongylus tenuis]
MEDEEEGNNEDKEIWTVSSNQRLVDHGEWCASIRDMLGLPTTSDSALPEVAHICEMHFLEEKRYTQNIMQMLNKSTSSMTL